MNDNLLDSAWNSLKKITHNSEETNDEIISQIEMGDNFYFKDDFISWTDASGITHTRKVGGGGGGGGGDGDGCCGIISCIGCTICSVIWSFKIGNCCFCELWNLITDCWNCQCVEGCRTACCSACTSCF